MLRIADVLSMPVVREADPLVVAAHGHLHREVRWVHTTELPDIAPLLRGGDLVMTTGIALPDAPSHLSGFAASLARSGAAGLMVELGRRWTEVPPVLAEECDHHDLPLVALRREVRFAAVTQAVGERLVDAQLAELREAHRVHDTFTELSTSEAGPEEILQAAQQLAAAPVVLENSDHRVLDYRAGPVDIQAFLADWERRSRIVQPDGRTSWDESNGWLVTAIGRRERRWGRLIIGAASPPPQRLVAVAERAAAALAMHRLHDRNRDSRTRRVHHELIVALLADPSGPDVARRVEVAGLATGSHLVGVAMRPATEHPAMAGPSYVDDIVTALLRSAEPLTAQIIVAAFQGEVRALVSLPSTTDPIASVDELVERVQAKVPVVAAAGTPVGPLSAADRTLRDAIHVLGALPEQLTSPLGVHRLEDLHVRGLLMLLSEDERLRSFVVRELAPLREADERHRDDLLRTARALVTRSGNKAAAAASLNISRPALYDRIRRLERTLGADLDDAEARTSLHLALLAEDLLPTPSTPTPE